MLRWAVDDDFSVYLSSMKDDPKTVQITYHPTVSLLIYNEGESLNRSNEIEISGKAVKVKDHKERELALSKLKEVSPVAGYLVENDNADILEVIKVIPGTIEYRNFGEITRGVPPTCA
ncbi:MAG: hypothetical protein DRP87_11920 [Spirochaetes bacterium]|nr:MAG: hypothetical protein DRP87_11920 [Spirochaetota bacterium]